MTESIGESYFYSSKITIVSIIILEYYYKYIVLLYIEIQKIFNQSQNLDNSINRLSDYCKNCLFKAEIKLLTNRFITIDNRQLIKINNSL